MSKENNVSYVVMDSYVTVVINDEIHTINKDSSLYVVVIGMLKHSNYEGLRNVLDKKKVVKDFIKTQDNNGRVVLEGNRLKYNGKYLDSIITSHILKMKEEGFDFNPMLKFVENLMQNPSYTSVKELYEFLKNANMFTITSDGCFLAYKKVTHDYKDIHTKTFDNSNGAIVEMPRYEVNDNRGETCSSGLHFCSYDYLSHFGNCPDSRVMIIKINPKDVVSIPEDYNNAKGRCCRYEVVNEVKNYKEKDVFESSVDTCWDKPKEGYMWCGGKTKEVPMFTKDAPKISPIEERYIEELENAKMLIKTELIYEKVKEFLESLTSKELCEVCNIIKKSFGFPEIKRVESKKLGVDRTLNMIFTVGGVNHIKLHNLGNLSKRY